MVTIQMINPIAITRMTAIVIPLYFVELLLTVS